MNRFRSVAVLLVLMSLLVFPFGARAQLEFEGAAYTSLPLARGESGLLEMVVRNTTGVPQRAELAMYSLVLGVHPQAYRLTAASSCPLPVSSPGWDSPVSFPLAPGERTVCAYRMERSLDHADAIHDLEMSFRLQPFDSYAPERIRSFVVGELADLRTRLVALGPPVRDGGGWRQSARFDALNPGPTDLTEVHYASCFLFPTTTVASVSAPCAISENALCFTGMTPTGLQTGPLAVGESVSCRVELVSSQAVPELTLPLSVVRKANGGRIRMMNPVAGYLTLIGVPEPAASIVPAQGWLSKLILLSLLIGTALLCLRLRSSG